MTSRLASLRGYHALDAKASVVRVHCNSSEWLMLFKVSKKAVDAHAPVRVQANTLNTFHIHFHLKGMNSS